MSTTPPTAIDSKQNPGSVYFLHPSDHANTKLVSHPFDGSGFGDWKRAMVIAYKLKTR